MSRSDVVKAGLVYRGILRTELVRRWSVAAGMLAANSLYTFGTLVTCHVLRVLALFRSARGEDDEERP